VTDTLRNRLIRIVGEAYDGYADPEETPNNWLRAESAIDAILAEMRTPTTEVILAGIETHDSVQWFWPLMIDRLRGAK
jgi:hypothetical protein